MYILAIGQPVISIGHWNGQPLVLTSDETSVFVLSICNMKIYVKLSKCMLIIVCWCVSVSACLRVFLAWLSCVQVCKQRQASALSFSQYRLLRVCFCQWRFICAQQQLANSKVQHRFHLRVKAILQQWRKHAQCESKSLLNYAKCISLFFFLLFCLL